jgi:predicted porin
MQHLDFWSGSTLSRHASIRMSDEIISIHGDGMKRLTTTGVVAGSLCLAVSAHAQSSMTLYGVLDAGLAYVHNVAGAGGTNEPTLFKFNSGARQGDRWGLKGSEDLGDGLSAVFQIENGFNIGSGVLLQGGREFGRQAFVELSDKTWGTVTLGRQYDPLVDQILPLTGDFMGGVFGTPGDLDNYDNSVRINNSIKYLSPTINGLNVEALYGFGGVAGTGNGQTFAGTLAYAYGPLSVAAGYFHANGGDTTLNGVRTWTSSADSSFNTAINSGFASARSVQIARVGARYKLGASTFGIAYSNVQYGHDAFSVFHETAKFNNGSIFYNYQFTPAISAGVGYDYTPLTGPASAHYHQLTGLADYAASLRTDIYLLAGYQRASGDTLSTAGQLIAAAAVIGDTQLNSGTHSQVQVIVGIRHRF